jgi:hypothetical protein
MPHLDDTRTNLDFARMSGTFAGVKTIILDCSIQITLNIMVGI